MSLSNSTSALELNDVFYDAIQRITPFAAYGEGVAVWQKIGRDTKPVPNTRLFQLYWGKTTQPVDIRLRNQKEVATDLIVKTNYNLPETASPTAIVVQDAHQLEDILQNQREVVGGLVRVDYIGSDYLGEDKSTFQVEHAFTVRYKVRADNSI